MSMAQEAAAASTRGEARADGSTSYRRVFNELCHMVALSRTGEATHVTDALVERAVVLSKPAPGDAAGLLAAIADRFGVSIPEQDVERAVLAMVQDGRLQRRDGHYALTAQTKARVCREIEDARSLEERVHDRWLDEAIADNEKLSDEHREALWRCLRSYMERVFQEHGALSAELLQAGAATLQVEDNLVRHATRAFERSGLPRDLSVSASAAIHRFFDSDDADRNEYIAQHLDATFTIFALSTPAAAAAYVRDQMPPLKLFLDTNFIFELLDLHVSPEQDVSRELVRFINENDLPVSLYYTPRTLREARETLCGIGERLKSRRWSPALSKATLETHTASGVELKYHSLNAEAPLSPTVFMRRYEDHITDLLKEFGVTMYRSKSEQYTDEEKALLVMEYEAYVTDRRPNLEKSYKTMEHDALVLLSLREHRNTNTSAIHSGALFLSNDRTLQRFDWEEFRGSGAPHVVLPQALLQVFRPFGRASQDANRRFARAFAVPEVRTAHSDYGETTAELRSHLATYQDLTEETAVSILGNELLRTRLQSVSDSEKFQSIVESEVVRLNRELVAEREALRATGDSRDVRIRDLESQVEGTHADLEAARSDAARLTEELEEALERESTRATETELLAAQVAELIQDKQEREAAADKRRASRRGFLRWLAAGGGAILTVAVLWVLSFQAPWLAAHDNRLSISLLGTLVLVTLWVGWGARRWKAAAVALVPQLFIGLIQSL